MNKIINILIKMCLFWFYCFFLLFLLWILYLLFYCVNTLFRSSNNASFGDKFLLDMEKASWDCNNMYKLGKVLHIVGALSK